MLIHIVSNLFNPWRTSTSVGSAARVTPGNIFEPAFIRDDLRNLRLHLHFPAADDVFAEKRRGRALTADRADLR